MNKNVTEALDSLFSSIASLYAQTYPHAMNTPAESDPYSFAIVHDDGQELIRSRCEFVEAHIEDLGESRGLRTRFQFVIVTCYNDDASWMEFSTPCQAARHFLLEQFRMNLSTRSPESPKFPRFWPKVNRVFRRNETAQVIETVADFAAN